MGGGTVATAHDDAKSKKTKARRKEKTGREPRRRAARLVVQRASYLRRQHRDLRGGHIIIPSAPPQTCGFGSAQAAALKPPSPDFGFNIDFSGRAGAARRKVSYGRQ